MSISALGVFQYKLFVYMYKKYIIKNDRMTEQIDGQSLLP